MNARLSFFKYSATGNDFILLDRHVRQWGGEETGLFHAMCRRRFGIGADGVLVLEAARRPDCAFIMRYFNRDGRESEMCGNGARAAAFHAATMGLAPVHMQFEVSGEAYQARVTGDRVELRMQQPRDLRHAPGVLADGAIRLPTHCTEGGYVNTGVPHYVLFVDTIEQIEVGKLGRELRYHHAFAPAGTNVDFVQRAGPGQIRLRTYERGVEEETLACGTGAVAAALFTHLIHGDAFPIALQTPGGELLVNRETDSGCLLLQGLVHRVFTGEYEGGA